MLNYFIHNVSRSGDRHVDKQPVKQYTDQIQLANANILVLAFI